MKRNFFTGSILFVLLVVHNNLSFAQNWTGNLNSDWNNSANWTGWPLGGDDIVIDPVNYTGVAASPVITANSVFTPGGMLVQNGAQLTVNANLSATDRVEITGAGTAVIHNAGTLHAAGGGSNGRFIVSDGATLTMNGGTLNANQRVIVELGALFTMNNGTITSGEVAVGDGNATASSSMIMHGGTINIDEMGFENEAGLFFPGFTMTGGTLNISGGMSWLGEAPGAGTPKFMMTGGTTTVGGDIINDPASTVDLYLELSGNAQFNFEGALIDMTRATDSILQSGNSVLTLTGTNTWNNPGIFLNTGARTVFNGNTGLNGTGNYTFHHVDINTTRTLTHVSPVTININGNLENNGTLNAGANTVVLDGATTQNINGNSVTAFYNLTVNNTSATGIDLGQAVMVNGHLQLTDGNINTTGTALLQLSDNATASQGSTESFVNGPMKKTGNDAFVFPIGKNDRWRRLEISAPSLVTSVYTAEYMNTGYVSLLPVSSPITAVSAIEHWVLDKTLPSDAVQVGLYWEDASLSAITDCAELSIGHWNGSVWNNVLATATGSCTGTGNGSITSTSAITEEGVFTFGFYDGVTVQTLNICHGDSVTVGTNTYNVSGTYVDVLTSSTMTDSVVITQLTVSAPASATLTGITLTADIIGADVYQWADCNNAYAPLSGETNQVFTATVNGTYAVIISNNGCTDTSACYTISTVSTTEITQENGMHVFPNPNNGRVTIEATQPADAYYRLTDLQGRLLRQGNIVQSQTQVDYTTEPSGIYLLEIKNNGFSAVTKLVKN